MIFEILAGVLALSVQTEDPTWTQLPVGYGELSAQYVREGRARDGDYANVWHIAILKRPVPSPQGDIYGYEYLMTFNCADGLRTVERRTALMRDGSRGASLPPPEGGPIPTGAADQAVYRAACPFRTDWPTVVSDTAGLVARSAR